MACSTIRLIVESRPGGGKFCKNTNTSSDNGVAIFSVEAPLDVGGSKTLPCKEYAHQ
jgi:hypothetical protein